MSVLSRFEAPQMLVAPAYSGYNNVGVRETCQPAWRISAAHFWTFSAKESMRSSPQARLCHLMIRRFCSPMRAWCRLRIILPVKTCHPISAPPRRKNVCVRVASIMISTMSAIRRVITHFSKCSAIFPLAIISRKRRLTMHGSF